MTDIALHFSTGDAAIDARLQAIVARYEAAFPARICGYYLFGSHADGSAVPASDLDLVVVFRGEGATREAVAAATDLAAVWSRERGTHLDVLVLGEGALRRVGHFRVKHGSVPLYGEDIRAALPAIAHEAYVRTYARAPVGYAARGFRHADRLAYPLTYPDPTTPFCGYVLDDPAPLKALVAAACWCASLLVTFEVGLTVATKADGVVLYRSHLGGPWADYLDTLYDHGKQRWGYRLPEATDERALLRDLCRRHLAFENHYFARYRRYLLDALGGDDPAGRRFAAEQLWAVRYPDAAVRAALVARAADDDATVRAAARRARAGSA